MSNGTVIKLLTSDDPLSPEAFQYLLNYREEDNLVDYKKAFSPNDSKQILALTVDVMAFANSEGGYLVFGIENGTYRVEGVPEEVEQFLSDVSRITAKINSNVSPQFLKLRSKAFTSDGKRIVLLFVPETKGKTHIFTTEGKYLTPDRKEQFVYRPGNVFIRRSAHNQLVKTADDFEQLTERRLNYYKDSLLSKITKVISAPPDEVTLTFNPAKQGSDAKTYLITGDKDGIPVKGIAFTESPKTPQELITCHAAIAKFDPEHVPRSKHLFSIYNNRETLDLNADQELAIIQFNSIRRIPCFYYIAKQPAAMVKTALILALKATTEIDSISRILLTGSIFEESFYKTMLKTVGTRLTNKLKPCMQSFAEHELESHCNHILKPELKYAFQGIKEPIRRLQVLRELLKNVLEKFEKQPRNDQHVQLAFAIDYRLYCKPLDGMLLVRPVTSKQAAPADT